MRQRIRKGLQGYMILLFPLLFMFFSPYLIVVAASQGIINGSATLFALLFVFSIFGSRLFCGWICSAGAIQEMAALANNKPWNSKAANLSKYLIWIVWFLALVYLWTTHMPLKYNFFFNASVDMALAIAYFAVVTGIYLFALFTGRRGMCHSLCWIAPFMVVGEKLADLLHLPRFRLKAFPENCISCGQCSKQCPMSLNVKELILSGKPDSTECIYCLHCVDICPKKAIDAGIAPFKRQ